MSIFRKSEMGQPPSGSSGVYYDLMAASPERLLAIN
jgi:hypothetical protein